MPQFCSARTVHGITSACFHWLVINGQFSIVGQCALGQGFQTNLQNVNAILVTLFYGALVMHVACTSYCTKILNYKHCILHF